MWVVGNTAKYFIFPLWKVFVGSVTSLDQFYCKILCTVHSANVQVMNNQEQSIFLNYFKITHGRNKEQYKKNSEENKIC